MGPVKCEGPRERQAGQLWTFHSSTYISDVWTHICYTYFMVLFIQLLLYS